MRNARFAFCICAIAIVLLAGARVVARADAAPPPSAAELKDAATKAPTTATQAAGDPGGTITGTVNDVPVGIPRPASH
jgi:Amt family ammonium transporter